jgi:hypothetical protein
MLACFLGLVFVSVGVVWLIQQKFPFKIRQTRILVTSESHPIFYWTWLFGQIAVGCFLVYRGIADIRLLVKQRRQNKKEDETT